MDATTLGSLLVGVGAVVGAVVAFVGKRGENALTGYSGLTDQLQEERDRLDRKVGELLAERAEQSALRAADQAEIARLRLLITQLGGQP
ncbi:hypothetical protein AB0E06_10040 [Streptomyces sp. NPDC048109]|uniref:hypothetical protein n=1 Tax=Streptomyces sp. NPDC048109 TaxID=3155482 RepID=UPI0034294E05